MDKEKIYIAAKEAMSSLIKTSTPVHADIINDAVAKAIAAAFEEYDKQKQ